MRARDGKNESRIEGAIMPKAFECEGNLGIMPEASINDAKVYPADMLTMSNDDEGWACEILRIWWRCDSDMFFMRWRYSDAVFIMFYQCSGDVLVLFRQRLRDVSMILAMG